MLFDNQAAYRTDFSTTDQIQSVLNKYINIKKGNYMVVLWTFVKHLTVYYIKG